MGIHYVDVFRTYVRTYKVKADSKEEAEYLVAHEDPSLANNYEDQLYDIEQVFLFTEQEENS